MVSPSPSKKWCYLFSFTSAHLASVFLLLFIFKNFHIIVVQEDTLWHLYMYWHYILIRFTTSIVVLPPFLEQFQQISLLCFHMCVKVHLPYSLSFTLSVFYPSLPTGTHSQIGPVLLSCPSVLKCIFIVKSGNTMAFSTRIYCTSFRLTPYLIFPSSCVEGSKELEC
jgi:hypothetical protein